MKARAKVRTAVIFATIVAACQKNEGPVPSRSQPTTAEKARGAITRALRDPESARFRGSNGIELGPWAGSTVRIDCGLVNAKNGFGGYTGEEPWYVITFQDGSAGTCLGKVEDCTYILTGEIARVARACIQSIPN